MSNKMTYREAVDYINSFLVFGSKPGLGRISYLLELLGNPQKKLKFIHVAGTNGKGSVCAYLSCILQSAGYKTGCFTSPYVVDFAERFQIDGENISHDDLGKITTRVRGMIENIPKDKMPTEFEVVTAIGLLWFYEQKCDVVVLEVGLGGLYDSTNVIDTPLCSVICSISLDHTAILGNTVEEIAVQKAGIIKPNGKTVIYPNQPGRVHEIIKEIAAERKNELTVPDENGIRIIDESIKGTEFEYKNEIYKIKMLGNVQPINAVTAIHAVTAAFPNIPRGAIKQGLMSAKIHARCEVIDENRPIIADGAHNPDGVLALKGVLSRFVDKKTVAVMGMMKDKDIDTVLSEIAAGFDKIITVTVDNPRAISANELAKKASAYCYDVTAADSVENAVKTALSMTDHAVCFCGSFYMMTKVYGLLK